MMLRRTAETALRLLYPSKCVFCGRVIAAPAAGVCAGCLAALPYTRAGRIKRGDFFDGCTAPLYYEGAVRGSLLRFKFRQCSHYAPVYAALMAECVRAEHEGRFDAVTWVPVSAERRRERGYDQAELLARELSRILGAPEAEPLLIKTRHTEAQSGIDGAERRRANVSGAYEARSAAAGRRILLVDDIITTGATMSECAKTLLLAGADSVMGAVCARSHD